MIKAKSIIITLLVILNTILQANTDRSLKMMKIEQRVALVIGNNKYNSKKLNNLQNPVNDAKAMKSKLTSLGFKVSYGENLSVRDMDKKLRTFKSKLSRGGVGLFFFAGHGVESQGKNYLMGKDSNIVNKIDIAYESLELNKVLDTMKSSGNRLNIVLLDACRNDPFARSGGGGLAKVDNAQGMFIAYATSPGNVASDGSGMNGLFTQQILNHIDAKGVPIGRIFKRIKRGVYDKSSQMQRPWTHDDIIGDFYFTLPEQIGHVVTPFEQVSQTEHINTDKVSGYKLVEEYSLINPSNETVKLYKKNCKLCHETDQMGAPVVGNTNDWNSVIQKGLDDVIANAINGYQGMPAKGGNRDLTDNEITRIIKYIFHVSKVSLD